MIVTILSLAFMLAVVAMRVFGGWPTRITLLEYQRGVLYRKGLPVKEIGTGRHMVFSGIEKILKLDVRPIQVNYENQPVALRDGFAAVFAFSGAARVQDARKAIYSAANYNHVPSYVMLCCARLELNNCSAAQLKMREAVTERIVERAKSRLAAAGFELLSFRLTDLVVGQRAAE